MKQTVATEAAPVSDDGVAAETGRSRWKQTCNGWRPVGWSHWPSIANTHDEFEKGSQHTVEERPMIVEAGN